MRRVIALWVLVCGMPVASAWAADVLPPIWRDADNSTYQRWEFDTSTSLWPDQEDNPYDQPAMTVNGANWLSSAQGRQDVGVWRLPQGTSAALEFFVPNDPVERENKSIWCQVTYWSPSGDVPGFAVDGYSPGVTLILNDEDHRQVYGDGWVTQVCMALLQPNPDSETIIISSLVNETVYIDEVVIDTLCWTIPAPSALTAGLVGIAAVATRRRTR
jgi:hypothetical protein